jgi:hypothetical protein
VLRVFVFAVFAVFVFVVVVREKKVKWNNENE